MEKSREFEKLRAELSVLFNRVRQTLLWKFDQCPENNEARLDALSGRMLEIDSFLHDFTIAVLSGSLEKLVIFKEKFLKDILEKR